MRLVSSHGEDEVDDEGAPEVPVRDDVLVRGRLFGFEYEQPQLRRDDPDVALQRLLYRLVERHGVRRVLLLESELALVPAFDVGGYLNGVNVFLLHCDYKK